MHKAGSQRPQSSHPRLLNHNIRIEIATIRQIFCLFRIKKNISSGTQGLFHLGMTVGALDTGTPQSNTVKHRDIVANDSRLAHHDARTVVDEDALSEFGAGVDVYLKLLIDLVLIHRDGDRWQYDGGGGQ